MERNYHFVYGRRVVLWADYKPLETICKKPLASAPKRLQCLLLRLQQYDVDTLSCAYLPTTDRSLTEKEVEQIHAVDFLAILEPQLAEIQQETAAEPVLQSLTQVIVKGWPEKKDDLLIELRPYFDVRDELTAQDGDLFKGLQCLILPSLRPKIHECLHGAHSGIKKKKRCFVLATRKNSPKNH